MRHLTLCIMIMASFIMAACSSSTTISEWSCPSDQPDGCFDVASGDAVALDQLTVGSGHKDMNKDTDTVTVSRTVQPQHDSGHDRPISISPSRPKTLADSVPVTSIVTRDIVASRQTASAMPKAEASQQTASAITAISAISAISASPSIKAEALPQTTPQSVRIPERLAMIRIGAFEDAAGNWHPASRLFIVIAPARWHRPHSESGQFESGQSGLGQFETGNQERQQ